MNTIQQQIMVALVKAQSAVISYGEAPYIQTTSGEATKRSSLDELDRLLKYATKLAKRLRKE